MAEEVRTRVVTTAGLVASVAAPVLAGVGWWTGWSEFLLAGAALAAVLLVAVPFVLGRSRYRVRVEITGDRVVVGSPAVGRLVVAHPGTGRAVLPVRMELPIGQGRAIVPIPMLRAGAEHEETFVVPTHRRAVITVGPVKSVRGDALGLLRREVVWTEPQELFVHPRTVALYEAAPGRIRDLEGQPVRELSSSDVAFHALRPYEAGDDRRHIHWRSSARTGTLMVRQFEQTRRSHLALALSLAAADYRPDDDDAAADEFETAVSVVASLAAQSFRLERPVTVVAGGAVVPARTARGVLDRLSAVETVPAELEQPGTGLLGSTREVVRRASAASMAVLVCGRNPEPAALRRAGAQFGLDVRTVAVRVDSSATGSGLRRIGGLTVVTVAGLDDLATALRAVTT